MDWPPGAHASTFGGNPVAIAAALATLDVLEREGVAMPPGWAAISGPRANLARKVSTGGDVRGLGRLIGIEIVTDKPSKLAGGPERDRIVELAFRRGLLLLGAGSSTRASAPR